MRSLEIAFKDLKTIVRDYKALAVIIAMPLVLMMILGAALGTMFEQGATISQFSIAVVDLDQGLVSKQLLETLESEELSQLISVHRVDSEQEARSLIDSGEVAAAVIVPAGASTAMGAENSSEQTASIQVLVDPAEELRGSIVTGIVETFTEQYSAIYAGTSAAVEALLTELAKNITADIQSMPSYQEPGLDVVSLGNSIALEIGQRTTRSHSLLADSREDKSWVSALQYYSAAMTVMFSLYGAMRGVESILEERDNRTLMRLFSTRATKTDVMVGKMLGILLTCLLQMTVLIMVTRLAFRVDWGASPLGVVVITLAVAVAATGFMVFLGSLAQTRKTATALQNVGVQLVAFLSGCTFPVFSFPRVLRSIAEFNFCWWGLKSYMTLMLGGSFAAVAHWALLISAAGILFLGLGVWRLRLE